MQMVDEQQWSKIVNRQREVQTTCWAFKNLSFLSLCQVFGGYSYLAVNSEQAKASHKLQM